MQRVAPSSGSPEQIALLSAALRAQGRHVEAFAAVENALARHRSSAPLLRELAAITDVLGPPERAIAAYRKAIRAGVADVATYVNFAALLGSLRRFEEALPVCRRAVERAPTTVAAHRNLASTLGELCRYEEALGHFAHAWALAPDDADLACDFADCQLLAGRVDKAIETLRKVLAANRHQARARSALLFALNFTLESAAQLRSEHAQCRDLTDGSPVPDIGARRPAASRTRVGILSGDLHRHSVSYFLAPLVDHFNREQFHLTLYSAGRIVDGVTAWLRSRADDWVEASAISDSDLGARIQRDAIDVLIDLSGHTLRGRPGVFARRPAPVQIAFLGYPTTTGLPTMDYRISDRSVDPSDRPTAGTERLLLLPHSYFCYRAPADAPEVAPPPLCRTGQITFGSFNTMPKVTDRTVALWGSVLRAIPASRLLMKGQALGEPAARDRLLARCAAAGIARTRVHLMDWQSDLRSHLSCYGQVDVALDTFPYNGATTTCEALWMGVPVVSLCGETHVARMGLSILKAAGRAHWVANSADEFVATCVALTADPGQLAAQRAALRAALKTCALMDEVSYVRDFEKLLNVAASPAG